MPGPTPRSKGAQRAWLAAAALGGGMAFAAAWGCTSAAGSPPRGGAARPEAEAKARDPRPDAPPPSAETPEPAALPADPSQPQPVLTAALLRLRRAAQERVLGRDAPLNWEVLGYAADDGRPEAAPETAGTETPDAPEDEGGPELAPAPLGRFVPIEHEAALAHFHRALARLAGGHDPDGKVRILAYGASHTQADDYTSYLRAYLQARFGDGGDGFVALGRVNPWYRTSSTRARHHRLKIHHARPGTGQGPEPLGLLGAAFVGRTRGAFGEIVTSDTALSTLFELHHATAPGGGDFTLHVDARPVETVSTASSTPGSAHLKFEVLPGARTVRAELRGNGPVRLFGIVAETARPGIVVDTLGIAGSRMSANLGWDEATWVQAVRHRAPDLVTFAYGTNELMDMHLASYERELRAVLARLRRAAPEVSCVLLSPFDIPKFQNRRWVQNPGVAKTVDAQRRISREFGCGFWDGHAFMGGAGSMRRWARAKPPLAQVDRVHLTRLGYVYAGTALGDALMRDYDLDPGQWAASPAPPGP